MKSALLTVPPGGPRSVARTPLARGKRAAAEPSVSWTWGALWLALFLGCLVPAALNRYPAAFGDTLNYLAAARDFRPTFERVFGYGAFLRASGGLWSLWLPAAAQAALAA